MKRICLVLITGLYHVAFSFAQQPTPHLLEFGGSDALVSPDKKTLYILNPSIPGSNAGGISVVELATRKVLRKILLSSPPMMMRLAADGKTMYVGTFSSNIFEVNLETYIIQKNISLPASDKIFNVFSARIALNPMNPSQMVIAYTYSSLTGNETLLELYENGAKKGDPVKVPFYLYALEFGKDGRVYGHSTNALNQVTFFSLNAAVWGLSDLKSNALNTGLNVSYTEILVHNNRIYVSDGTVYNIITNAIEQVLATTKNWNSLPSMLVDTANNQIAYLDTENIGGAPSPSVVLRFSDMTTYKTKFTIPVYHIWGRATNQVVGNNMKYVLVGDMLILLSEYKSAFISLNKPLGEVAGLAILSSQLGFSEIKTAKDQTFKVYNYGNKDLEINGIENKWAASVALTLIPPTTVVKPASSATVTVRMTALRTQNISEAYVQLKSNATFQPDSLAFSAWLNPKKLGGPSSDGDSLTAWNTWVGESRSIQASLISVNQDPITITKITSSDTSFVKVTPNTGIASNVSFNINLDIRPRKIGYQYAWITLTNDGVEPQYKFKVSTIASGGPLLSLPANPLVLGLIPTGTIKTYEINLTNVGTETLQITNVLTTLPELIPTAQQLAILPKETKKLGLVLRAKTLGFTMGGLYIYSNTVMQTNLNSGYNYLPITYSVVVDTEEEATPSAFRVLGVYPNPVPSQASVSYSLPTTSHVKWRLLDITGREVLRKDEGVQEAGYLKTKIEAKNLAAGVYFLVLTAGDKEMVQKIVHLN